MTDKKHYKTTYNEFDYDGNKLFIRRDDLYPFSFGGNKALKAELYFEDILSKNSDAVVTYGSSSSNHCRIVANKCAQLGIDCYIITPKEDTANTYNSVLVDNLGAVKIFTSLDRVSRTIDECILRLTNSGKSPYFIRGGGHGVLGTQAYVSAFDDIADFEKEKSLKFDYIFFASGTGTTHAGLEVGKHIHGSAVNVIGISVARNSEKGKSVIVEAIKEFCSAKNLSININTDEINFNTDYISGGYGKYNDDILKTIESAMKNYGIPLNTCYTGKAFFGMTDIIAVKKLKNKNILFINTGGEPLFFDGLNKNNGK